MSSDKTKRCLFISNHFFPEFFRGNDMVAALVKQNYDVTVLTNIPNYPHGKFFDNYSLFRKRTEIVFGAKIIRTPVIPRGKGGKFRLVLEYLSGCLSLWLYSIFIALFHRRYDVVIVQQLSPIYVCWSAIAYKRIRRVPIITWVLDLWPDSLSVAGIKNNTLINIVSNQSQSYYKKSDALLVTSKGMIDRLIERGINSAGVGYLPNWFENVSIQSYDGILPDLPDGFKVMFAGNMGEAQNLDNVIAMIATIPSTITINWIFVGDGRHKKHIMELVRANCIEDRVTFIENMPVEAMPAMFAKADVMLVSLRNLSGLNDTLPAKVQAYMANSKPILCIANGETQHIISEAKCGWCIGADDVLNAAEVIANMYNTPVTQRTVLGANGYSYLQKHFTKAMCMDKLVQTIEHLTS